MNTIGERLRNERERIGFNQSDFAEAGGVLKRAQIHYEKNERMPDAGYLSAIAAAGADVLYILTGSRSAPAAPAISREEAAFLDNYRHSPKDAQESMQTMCAALAQSSVHPQGVGRGCTADKSATATLKKSKAA